MICKKCGYEIPKHLMGGAILTCPTCGYRYHKRPVPPAPSTKPAPQRSSTPAVGMPFRLARTIIGILSLVAFIFVMFQSCAANVVNAMEANTADASAGGGTLLAFILLIAGITTALGRDNAKATLVAAIMYEVGAIIGFASLGTYSDLVFWSIIAVLFGALDVYSWWRSRR